MNVQRPQRDTADVGHADDDPKSKLLSREQAQKIIDYVRSQSIGGGKTTVMLGTIWQQTLRWSRNEVNIAGDRYKQSIAIGRQLPGCSGSGAEANNFKEETLLGMLRTAERRSSIMREFEEKVDPFSVVAEQLAIPDIPLWSDTTSRVTADARTRLANIVSDGAAERGLVSAGYVEVRIASYALQTEIYGSRFAEYSLAESSVTVRHPKGTGSGWAGISGFDWGRFDTTALASVAIDKCVRSIDPVRVEPGRYTVVLEPQAVADITAGLASAFSRRAAENGNGPFTLEYTRDLGLWITKLGLRVIDERISIYHDPTEEGTGVLPERGLEKITWIENGVLRELEDGEQVEVRANSSLPGRNMSTPRLSRRAYKMSGGTTSVEEMISTTKRGLWVTRFHGTSVLDRNSILSTGVTRDGLWLIEDGRVTKAVKNLRFLESPIFMLNRVDQLGVPQQTYKRIVSAGGAMFLELAEFIIGPQAAVVPPVKAHDFNFVSLVDAV